MFVRMNLVGPVSPAYSSRYTAAPTPTGADPIAGLGVAVDVTVAPVPGVSAGVHARAGLDSGVEVGAAWHAGLLGSGTLAVDVANPAADALVGAHLVVDLSPGARPTSLLGTTCRATDPSLV